MVLKDRLNLCEKTLLIVDLNDIISITDKFVGKDRFDSSMKDSWCYINDVNLINLGFVEPSYTWSNKRWDI